MAGLGQEVRWRGAVAMDAAQRGRGPVACDAHAGVIGVPAGALRLLGHPEEACGYGKRQY